MTNQQQRHGFRIGLGMVLVFLGAGWLQAADLSVEQKLAIGKKIWQNECAGTVEGLTTWNAGEEFPSLGIGHFIWYPQGVKGRFHETWPAFVKYAQGRGVKLPSVGEQAHCPWSSKSEFQKQFGSDSMVGLRKWLAAHVAVQTEFIMDRSKAALPKIVAAAPKSERARIERNYHKVASTAAGMYALIDYVNFKGEGVLESERYQGRGWGILQVLGEMKEVEAGVGAAKEFGQAAKRVLSRRIANSPPERGEKRWEKGWHNRCDGYGKGL